MANGREVLRQILETAELDHAACAMALGLSEQVFSEILSGRRDIPDSLVPLMAAVMGVNESLLSSPLPEKRKTDMVPAIWYKLRGSGLTEVDRGYVLALRQLAFYQHELESITDSRAVGWQSLFEQLRRENDPQASPTEQGRQAARLFRRSTGLGVGARGVGEVFRGYLRNIGILVIESSARESVLDGCSFYVGPSGAIRPCLFANSYSTTWFRRNRILMHELAHAIFDVESAIATLDFSDQASADSIQESRADAFAQESLIPSEVLRHIGQTQHINWTNLQAIDIANLVAETHVEQRLLAKALAEAQIISSQAMEHCESCDIAAELRSVSKHAMSTEEFIRTQGAEPSWLRGRTTTSAPQKMLLPSKYVGAVLDAFNARIINRGKASRMLMIDEYEFQERFAKEVALS